MPKYSMIDMMKIKYNITRTIIYKKNSVRKLPSYRLEQDKK